ncbi:MAG: hypothetical protein H7222_17030, partial [Methylotenera sp.]|nr:hypothetical protein [Oligoflexia bacterium]
MKNVYSISVLFFLASVSTSLAAGKDYQITGEVKDVSDSSITVMKGKEKFEITRDAATKAPAGVKAGDKVTVYYTMKASEIEAKAAK